MTETEHDDASPPRAERWDPLVSARGSDGSTLDVLLSGPVFFDLVFTGLAHDPAPGTEVWAAGMGSAPGGISNLAVAASRLGLRTGLAAGFGDDVYGKWCWDVLSEQEQVDLQLSRRFPGWHSAVTVSMAIGGDRSMVTHGHPVPMTADELIGTPPAARAVITELVAMADGAVGGAVESAVGEPWWRQASQAGALVFADVGWDESGSWDVATLDALSGCHAFMPNSVEAMAYTRTSSPRAALHALADRVPFAVVTCGGEGALAVDSSTGEEADVPPILVKAIDPTGAGDVFGASLVLGTLASWPLTDRLAFSALCSALAVQQFGGSLAAPGWGDISDWWRRVGAAADAGNQPARELVARYSFLGQVLPSRPVGQVRRAEATLAVESHLPPVPGAPPSAYAGQGGRMMSAPSDERSEDPQPKERG